MVAMPKVSAGTHREIRVGGTVARVVVGLGMVGAVVWTQVPDKFNAASWAVGLVGFPAAMLAWQWWRVRRDPVRFCIGGGRLGHVTSLAAFLALFLTAWYAPPIAFVSDATLLFYGTSMLIAAARGHAGCEVLTISNWMLRRNDQLGCVLFDDLDRFESRSRGSARDQRH